MLEFYYKYSIKSFASKSKKLAQELTSILLSEGIRVEGTDELHIPIEYREKLGIDLFDTLNSLYYTLRKNNANKHFLLRKYLPELKNEPTSNLLFADFFCGAGGLSQGLVNAGFQHAFVN